jgi:hypothetical protein
MILRGIMLKSGDRVRMTEALKVAFRKNCLNGIHQGPMGIHDGQCWDCSGDHVDEFGDCVGVVEDLVDFGCELGPEVNVRWEPSGLRYGYLLDELELAND